MEKQKRGAASEMSFYPDAPAEPVSASELIRQQQEILAKNGENQRKRDLLMQLCREREEAKREAERIREKIEELRAQHQEIAARHDQLHADVQTAEKTAEQLQDESTAEIEASLQEIDAINQKVRINAARENAIAEADKYKDMYDGLTADIDDVRTRKMKLLEGAELPLEGLTIENKELVYKGSKWDCMSGAEQLMVATAIVRKLNENCEFVLLDKLEQMDLKTLNEFALWAEGQGLQLIATRVSTGDECSILIEDGYSHTVDAALDVEPMTMQEIEEVATTAWQAGVF